MAEIPIEKKSGTPGWLWPLLALLLGGLLLWWLLTRDNDEERPVETTTVTEQTVDTTATTPATGVAAAGAAGAAAGAAAGTMTAGQAVNLQNARVTSLTGDTAFTADAQGQNMFVVFDETAFPADGANEGQIDVQPGMAMNIEGTVRSASEPMPQGITAQLPAGTTQYVHATRLTVVQ